MKSLRLILALALLGALFSLGKFLPCRATNWGAPDVYIKMCYSDIPALYGARELDKGVWPYQSEINSVEYPVITGLVMWATGLLVDDFKNYFDLNLILLILLFLATAILVSRIREEFVSLYLFAPAVLASLFINWDLWAVSLALLAIFFFQREKFELSAVTLGIAVATKFFPVVILGAVALFFWRDLRSTLRYFTISVATWLVINLPVAVTNFGGWSRFYRMNIERGSDLGSLWLALELNGVTIARIGIILVAAVSLLWLFNRALQSPEKDFNSFTINIFILVALFVTLSPVYSPQYVLWLTPLGVIAMRDKSQRSAFWIWQGAEALYHFAIWQYLALNAGAKFGLSEGYYSLAIVIRVLALAWFVRALIHSPRSNFTMSVSRDTLSHLRG